MIHARGMWTDGEPWNEEDTHGSRWRCCTGGGTSSTQSTKVDLPPYLEAAATKNLGAAQDYVDNTQYQPYTDPRIAPQTPDQLAAAQSIRDMQGTTGAALDTLGNRVATQIGGYTPDQVTAGQVAGTNLQPYMDPYTNEVEKNSLAALEDQRQQAQGQLGDKFQAGGAYGGSRFALQGAVTDSLAARQAADLSAKLHSDNFMQAQAAATGDINRTLSADTSNQAADLSGAQLNLAGLNAAGALASGAQDANVKDFGLLDTSGQQQQAMQQGQLDVNYQNFLEKQGFSKSQIEWLQQMIGSSPGSQTTTINAKTSGSGGSALAGAAGGALSGASAGAMFGPWGAGIGAVAGGLLGGLSKR